MCSPIPSQVSNLESRAYLLITSLTRLVEDKFFDFLHYCLAEESSWANCGVSGITQCLLSALSTGNTVRKWELNLSLGELHTVDTLQVRIGNSGCSDDLDGSRAGTVATSHLVVKLGDSSSQRNVSELTVHIVCPRSRRITKPDSVVLDDAVVLLNNLDAVKDLTGSLLHFTELVHVVPEFRLGNHLVWGEDDHSVGLRVWNLIGGSLSAHHLVLTHNSSNSHLKTKM